MLEDGREARHSSGSLDWGQLVPAAVGVAYSFIRSEDNLVTHTSRGVGIW